jgi:hypothetical protein
MDAIVILTIGLYLALKTKGEKINVPELEVRRNPNFYKDENAFMKLFNLIMKGDG